jgi:hypothetical protein
VNKKIGIEKWTPEALADLHSRREAAYRATRLTPEEAIRRRKEASRKSALAAYHAKADRYNANRRIGAPVLEAALRRVLRETHEPAIRLEVAFRKVLRRASNAAEEKIRRALRRRFEKAMRSHKHSNVVFQLSGISLAGLRQRLESLFQPGMTWDNYGFYGWHIDHKRPLASFTLPAEQAEAFHYMNLQPLWWRDNLSKGSKHV